MEAAIIDSIKVTRVSNMQSNKGNDIANQFLIHTEHGVLLRSYGSNIAFKAKDGNLILDERHWDYSKTTGKYRNLFLGETKKETQAKIDSGEYTLANLN